MQRVAGRDNPRRSAPSGTVAFLFTDIEGSTHHWEAHPQAMAAALRHHDRLVRRATEAHHGYIFATGGDGFGILHHMRHGKTS